MTHSAGANDTSSSLHPTSSDSLEKVAMHERVVVGEEATGGAQEGTGAAEDAVDAADESGDTVWPWYQCMYTCATHMSTGYASLGVDHLSCAVCCASRPCFVFTRAARS